MPTIPEIDPGLPGEFDNLHSSPPIDEMIDRFWDSAPELDSVEMCIEPPETPLALLEKLGPSPFLGGGFPLIGFLATTYEKVSRYAIQRR